MEQPSVDETAGPVVQRRDDPRRERGEKEAAALHQCRKRPRFGCARQMVKRDNHHQCKASAESRSEEDGEEQRGDLRREGQSGKAGGLHRKAQP